MTGGPPGLRREVGLAGLTAIAVNGVIGSGIFVLPATVAALLGPASPLAYLVAAFVTSMVVLCFAEAGSRFDETGGPYLYAREAFGGLAGFMVGWMFLLSRLAAGAAIANAFVAYFVAFWPPAASRGGRLAAISLAVLALGAVNLVGVRHGSRTVNVLAVAKLLPLLVLVGVGLSRLGGAPSGLFALADVGGLKQASLLLIFAFGGFENASVPGEEARDPRRHLPVALLVAVAFTTVLYMLIQAVSLATLPDLAREAAPLAAAGRVLLGPRGADLITLGALLSTLGSMSAVILVGPRILYAFGRGGQMPARLGRVHPVYRTPHVAVGIFAFLVWAAAAAGTFAQLAAVSAIARLTFSAATCIAVPVLRRKLAAGPHVFTVPGGNAVPVLAALASLWLLSGITSGQAVAGGAALLAGLALYLGVTRSVSR